jgi:hypothetical protein
MPIRICGSVRFSAAEYTVARETPSRAATSLTVSKRSTPSRRGACPTGAQDSVRSGPFRATPSGRGPEAAPEMASGSAPVPLGPTPSTIGEAASGPRGRRFKSCLPDFRSPRTSSGNWGSRASSFTVREWAAPPARHAAEGGSRVVRIRACERSPNPAISRGQHPGTPVRNLPPLGREPTGFGNRERRTFGGLRRCEASSDGANQVAHISAEEGRRRRPGSSECSHRQLLRRLDEETERRGALRAAREVQEEPGHGGRVRFEHDLQPSGAQLLPHRRLEGVREPRA